MRTNKQKKIKNSRQGIRSLKIQPKTRLNTYSDKDVPEIKLCGNWLEQLGFHHGKRVVVTPMNGLLIIKLQPE